MLRGKGLKATFRGTRGIFPVLCSRVIHGGAWEFLCGSRN